MSMVTICQTCGDGGFSNALVFCDECQIYAVHRYCLAVLPETFDEYVVWLCEDCESKTVKEDFVSKISTKCESLGTVPVKRRKSVKQNKKKSKRKVNTSSLNESIVVELEKSSSVQLLEVNCSEKVEKDQEYERQKESDECIFNKSVKNSLLDPGDCQPLEMTCSDDGEKDEKHGKDVSNEDGVHEEADSLKTNNSLATLIPEANSSESFETKKAELAGQDTDLLEIVCFEDGDKDHKNEGQKKLDEGIPCRTENNPNFVKQNYVLAQPIAEPIWRGRLSISDKIITRMLGLVAHVSNLACPKVGEEARSLPAALSTELLPRSKLWPKGFAKWGPSDDSIALYFFPDSERNEKNFDGLVDDMICQDLGLRAVVQNVELLIFTSTLMPMDFWRFQSKFYLWGVFKAKRSPQAVADGEKCLAPVMDRQSPVNPLGNGGSDGCGSISATLSPSKL